MMDARGLWRAVGAFALLLVSVLTLAWSLGRFDRPDERRLARPFHLVIPPKPKMDVIYVPTPREIVDQMLELAEVKPGDVVYDLGCGDGRIVVTAAKRFGVKGVGFDIDPVRVAEARKNARENGVEHLVTIRQDNLFNADLSPATVITLFLLPELNVRLKPKLAALRPGTRIVSHAFPMRGARPKRVEALRRPSIFAAEALYLWVVPWEKSDPRDQPSSELNGR